MDASESPYAVAAWMADSMMIAVAADIPNVKGNASVTANIGPSPGNAPMIKPKIVPPRRYIRFTPCMATCSPSNHSSMNYFASKTYCFKRVIHRPSGSGMLNNRPMTTRPMVIPRATGRTTFSLRYPPK